MAGAPLYRAATLNLGNKKIRSRILGILAHAPNYCTFTFACLIMGHRLVHSVAHRALEEGDTTEVRYMEKNLIFTVWAHHKGWNVLDS